MNELEFHLLEEARSGQMTRQQLIVRSSVLGVSATALGTILAACGSSAKAGGSSGSPGSPKRGGSATISVDVPAQDVDPVTMYNEGAIATTQCACEYLCYPRPDYTLDPRLATKWQPGTTPDTWDFTIRQGVKWHDGSALTVDDVVATFDRITNPKVNSAALSAFSGILSSGNIEKVDAQTVRFHLDRPYADFPYLVSPFNYNAVILPANYEIGQFSKGGIGTGAFILKAYSAGQQATFVRNPHYWDKGLPYLESLTMKYYQDSASQVLALEGGSIDVMDDTPYQGSQALFNNPDVVVLENPSSQYRTLQMRVDTKPFSDVRVRQAVAYALDRPGLVRGVLGGNGQVGNDHAFAPIYPGSPGPGEIEQRTQDYGKAKSLLAAAGFSSGLTVTLTTEQYLEIPEYAQYVQAQCKPAGINVKLDVEPQSQFYGTGSNQPWLQVPFGITDWASRGTASQTIDPAYLCRSVPNESLSNSGAAWNSAHWCDPAFDGLVEKFEAEVDQQKRHRYALEAATIQRDQVPDVIAYWIKELRSTRKNVHGIWPGVYALDPRAMWLS